MKRFITRVGSICVALMLVMFSALFCGCGFNKIMREHLSDPDNYYEFTIEVTRIYTYNGSKAENRYTDVTSPADINLDAADWYYIDGKVLDGNEPDLGDDYYSKRYELNFEISQANVLHLLSTDFYNVIEVGDKLQVRSTWWVYGDRDWRYIAEIKLNNTVYLGFDEGLQNIIDYMNANKSLF